MTLCQQQIFVLNLTMGVFECHLAIAIATDLNLVMGLNELQKKVLGHGMGKVYVWPWQWV